MKKTGQKINMENIENDEKINMEKMTKILNVIWRMLDVRFGSLYTVNISSQISSIELNKLNKLNEYRRENN